MVPTHRSEKNMDLSLQWSPLRLKPDASSSQVSSIQGSPPKDIDESLRSSSQRSNKSRKSLQPKVLALPEHSRVVENVLEITVGPPLPEKTPSPTKPASTEQKQTELAYKSEEAKVEQDLEAVARQLDLDQ